MVALPIDPHLPEIVATVRARGTAVVVAAPGAGKTTRLPPALCADGPLILLQPRRVAARAIARRIAAEQSWTLGEEVGWQVRFEHRFSERTRLLVATEGVLTARLQADPLLGGFRTVVLDEFHERSLHADLALALARQARRARGDLRLVVMSATLDAEAVAAFLDDCPVFRVYVRAHPVAVEYRPGTPVPEAARQAVRDDAGHVLCFLPGAAEIRRAAAELAHLENEGIAVLPLHGGLDAEAQDAAVASPRRKKLILATNIAETSLTIDGVTEVVDSGLHKVARYDADKGIDRLETERIPWDSAEQRTGRAGRTGPGRAVRLWDARDALRPRRDAEIRRVDLAGPLLEILAWGGDPATFEWFEAPPADAAAAALELLGRLGAVEGRRLTALGERLRRFPLHPRLARVLAAADDPGLAAAACAVLSERLPLRPSGESTASDVLSLIDRLNELPPGVRDAARQLERLAARASQEADRDARSPEPVELRRALLLGFPDRVARRREPASPRLLLCSGHGAVLARESGVREGEFLVALDVAAGGRGPGSEALVRLASRVEREWLVPTGREQTTEFVEATQGVRAVERILYDTLVLSERPVAPDADEAARLLAASLKARGLDEDRELLMRRLRFADVRIDRDRLLEDACRGCTSLADVDLRGALPPEAMRDLARLAPETLPLPSGRRVPLEYREDGTVAASVKLQELFGLGESPRLGPRAEAVLLLLLAPNGRPVQTTRDLRSFWERTYPEVRKELRGRYPRHPWPEDPWTAPPTARPVPRR
jgi:ATP-dependent helicase HrpB